MRPLAGVQELARHLPPGEGVVVYIDVAALRRTGVLGMLDGNAAYREQDYRNFVSATGFDYREDLDAVLLAFRGEDRYYLLTGRFVWSKLSDYARSTGGRCLNGQCVVASSYPERFISFLQVRPGLMGMGVSRETLVALQVASARREVEFEVPSEPVWIYLPASAMRATPGLPVGLSQFLAALEGAQSATAALGGTTASFELRLTAKYLGTKTASLAAEKLTESTKLVAELLQREGKRADPAGLSGMLCSGKFEARESIVTGRWPLSRAFLETVAGGNVP